MDDIQHEWLMDVFDAVQDFTSDTMGFVTTLHMDRMEITIHGDHIDPVMFSIRIDFDGDYPSFRMMMWIDDDLSIGDPMQYSDDLDPDPHDAANELCEMIGKMYNRYYYRRSR